MSVTQINRDINELTPSAQTACRLFLEKCKQQGLKVRITETYRSQERQDYLYEQGRTRPGQIVTWTKNSRHTSRRAWDICKDVKGEEYSDSNFFRACGKVANSLGIIWGGNWRIPDPPHFEVPINWQEPNESEELTMAQYEELKEMIQQLTRSVDRLGDRITKLENPMIYNYIDKNMPEWARPTIQKLVDKNYLQGNGQGELGLDYTMLRILTILDRTNVFN